MQGSLAFKTSRVCGAGGCAGALERTRGGKGDERMRLGVMLLAAAVAFGAVDASTRVSANESAKAKFVYEIWYEVERNMDRQFDLYFANLKEASSHIGGPERWVDANHARNKWIVSLPAARLADYRSERYVEAGLRAWLGDAAFGELSKGYSDAQVSRKSYIREYRADLGFNRHHHSRYGLWATEYVLVTIEPGNEKDFERLWRAAVIAYARLFPRVILIAAKTLVGGGPQYVITRPLEAPADADSFPSPVQAMDLAFGSVEARTFASGFHESVNKWETLVFARTNLDTIGAESAAHEGK